MRPSLLLVVATLVVLASSVDAARAEQRQRWPNSSQGKQAQGQPKGQSGGNEQPRGEAQGQREKNGDAGGQAAARTAVRREAAPPAAESSTPPPQPAPQRAGVQPSRTRVPPPAPAAPQPVAAAPGAVAAAPVAAAAAPAQDQRRAVPRGSRPQGDNPQTGVAVPRRGPTPSPDDDDDHRGGGRIYGYGYPYPPYYYYPRRYYPYGYGAFGLGYFYYDPYNWYPYYGGFNGYGYGYATGELRLDIEPREAEVYVDGYYAGKVDDFDGIFQALRLEEGPYKIEIVAPGYETAEFNVRIQPGRKITYRQDLIKARP